jgi:hypothetical protein
VRGDSQLAGGAATAVQPRVPHDDVVQRETLALPIGSRFSIPMLQKLVVDGAPWRCYAGSMSRPSFVIDVRRVPPQRGADLERDLQSGGLFVPGVQHALNSQCEVRFLFQDAEHSVDARVVFADVAGVGLELQVLPDERAALAEKFRWAREQAQRDGAEGEADEASDGDEADDGDATVAGSHRRPPAHVRVRNLNVAEQLKMALHGEQQERILLERLYGKLVWEALLRNPRITSPEVARIARMGALPKPLLEIIVANSAWLQIPEIRRSLLGNPRLAPEMIGRVLRLLPRHELKLVPAQLAYPAPVRDVARRMLKD